MALVEHWVPFSLAFDCQEALIYFVALQYFCFKISLILPNQLLIAEFRRYLEFHATKWFLLLVIHDLLRQCLLRALFGWY